MFPLCQLSRIIAGSDMEVRLLCNHVPAYVLQGVVFIGDDGC
jgi:hypothetical protein